MFSASDGSGNEPVPMSEPSEDVRPLLSFCYLDKYPDPTTFGLLTLQRLAECGRKYQTPAQLAIVRSELVCRQVE